MLKSISRIAVSFVIAALMLSPAEVSARDWALAMGDNGEPVLVEGGDAVGTAMEQCEHDTNNCSLMAAGNQRCVAIAKSQSIWAAVGARSKSAAFKAAMTDCEAQGGRACEVIEQFC